MSKQEFQQKPHMFENSTFDELILCYRFYWDILVQCTDNVLESISCCAIMWLAVFWLHYVHENYNFETIPLLVNNYSGPHFL